MAKKTKSTSKKPMSKGGKIAIISISAALVIGGAATAIVFSTQIKEFIDKWFHGAKIASVDEEYKTEQGVVINDPETGEIKEELPYLYLGSAEQTVTLKDEEGKETQEPVSAHTFLIGRVNSVPFYQSGWTRFDYENIGMTISFSQISTTSVSNSLSTTNERVESSSWSQSTHFQEKFVASVEGGIGPIKAKAENTIDYQVDKSSSGSSMSRYVSSNEQTNTSIETLQKTADYSIQLNSKNGFKKGKYYRMTLQQTASMYMVIYEKAKADDKQVTQPADKFYELTSFLADPSNYTMVVEEADDPAAEPRESAKFDSNLYDECAKWIEDVRTKDVQDQEKLFNWVMKDEEKEPESRYDQLNEYYGSGVTSVQSDYYYRNAEWLITDAGKEKNPSDKVTFPTLFKSKLAPTFRELFNKDTDPEGYKGYGFKYVDIEIQFEFRRINPANQHVYLVDKNGSKIYDEVKDIDDYKSWTKRNITWNGIDAIDKLRTTMDPTKADGWVHVMYDGSGKSDDDWRIRNFIMQVTIRKG